MHVATTARFRFCVTRNKFEQYHYYSGTIQCIKVLWKVPLIKPPIPEIKWIRTPKRIFPHIVSNKPYQMKCKMEMMVAIDPKPKQGKKDDDDDMKYQFYEILNFKWIMLIKYVNQKFIQNYTWLCLLKCQILRSWEFSEEESQPCAFIHEEYYLHSNCKLLFSLDAHTVIIN